MEITYLGKIEKIINGNTLIIYLDDDGIPEIGDKVAIFKTILELPYRDVNGKEDGTNVKIPLFIKEKLEVVAVYEPYAVAQKLEKEEPSIYENMFGVITGGKYTPANLPVNKEHNKYIDAPKDNLINIGDLVFSTD